MSDTLDIQEQVARIRRSQAESDKFAAAQRKLMEASHKLFEEGLKFRSDRLVQPIVATAALLGGLGGIVTLIQLALRAGGLP